MSANSSPNPRVSVFRFTVGWRSVGLNMGDQNNLFELAMAKIASSGVVCTRRDDC